MLGALLPLAGAAIGALGNVFSARQAQGFAERMSSTAHQREVRDLVAAGINPMVGAAGSGASTPSAPVADVSGGAERGSATALAVRAQRAQIELIEAQRTESAARANYIRGQANDLSMQGLAGRYELIRQQVASGALGVEQKKALLPLVIEQARAEINSTVASADRAVALTALDKLAATGAVNVQEFEKTIGPAGQWVRLLLELVRGVR